MATSRLRVRQGLPSRQANMVYLAMALSIIAIAVSAVSYTHANTIYVNKTVYVNSTSNGSGGSSNGTLSGLSGINSQISAADLATINNAQNSYFETAGEMYLNGSLANSVGTQAKSVNSFMVNGKPSVIYLGSITCIFCGENRWAMALALSRFGNFSALYTGYSALGDGDVPTLYWTKATYNRSSVDMGSFYSSKYINFIVFESTDPITGGFDLQPLAQIQQIVNQSGNSTYMKAFDEILQLNNFQGTPYTIWGTSQVGGADGVDFGNNSASAPQPLAGWTHEQVFSLLRNPNSQFAWTEYAAADLYIAMTCPAINNSAPVCQLPAITQIEKANGY